jgi:hypothetical protein
MSTNATALAARIGFETPVVERYFVTNLTNLVSWPITCVYVLILYVICANAKLRKNSFFVLAINLGIADIMQMITIMLHGVFISATANPYEVPYYLNEFHVWLNMGSFVCQLIMMNVIAFNRYVGTCWFQYYKQIFTKKVLICICVFSWGFGIFMNMYRYIVTAELIYMVTILWFIRGQRIISVVNHQC